MNPFFLMTILYLTLAALGALDVALVNFEIFPMFAGFRWLRIHFITLGAMTEFLFGVLPIIVAMRANKPRPRFRWDVWFLLNIGIVTLLVSIPLINQTLITVGGTLIFIAAVLLGLQLMGITPQSKAEADERGMSGRWFYIMGIVYLLLGVLIGTGLWQPWLRWFAIQVPIEVHIHANNWGFMSLVFAGLLVDLYPRFSGQPLASKQAIRRIFWMMTIGALGLILGPWFKSNLFSVPGLILHLSATIWVLLSVVKPILNGSSKWTIGTLHIVTSYVWILAPVFVAPLIILQVPGFPGAGIEQNAPQALIYGWVLQFSYAIIPLFVRSLVQRDEPVALGGHWLSLITVHLGGVLLWSGIFMTDSRGTLHGVAYLLWAVSLLPILWELWQIIQQVIDRDAPTFPVAEAGD